MIEVISDKKEILKYYKKFLKNIKTCFNNKVSITVGYSGGNFKDTVQYSTRLDFWFSHHNNDLQNRYWNGFGIGKPEENRNHSLAGEINFPKSDINRMIAGVFARDSNGKILVLHRGKIGGGKKGVGKKLFMKYFCGDFATAIDKNRETEFAVVGELNSPKFSKQVATFIGEIKRIKDLQDSEKNESFSNLRDFKFTKEFSGQVNYDMVNSTVAERTHGIVVSALANELNNRKFLYANDKNRDLFIYNNKRQITIIFEIKTDTASSSLYSAIGQLILYSIPIKNQAKLIAVLPDKLKKTVEDRFAQIGIRILYYAWQEDEPLFKGIDNIIKK